MIDDDDATTPEGGSQIDAPTDAIPPNLDAPGDDVEAGVREDGQAKVDAAAPCPGSNPCDCDNDGFEAEGDACNGTDCDDRDPLIHPSQNYIATPPDPPNEGNWDCTDPIEKQYVVNLNCATLLGLGCPAAQGYRDDPPCGSVADYYQCQSGLLSCNPVKIGTRRQGCK